MEIGKIHYIDHEERQHLKRVKVERQSLKVFTTEINKIDDGIYDISHLDRRGLVVAIIPIEDCMINAIEYGNQIFYSKGIILTHAELFCPNYNANDLLQLINCEIEGHGGTTELHPKLLTRCSLIGNAKPDKLWIAYYERI